MIILTDTSRLAMMEGLKVAYEKGMLNEIKHKCDIFSLTEDELLSFFIIVMSRLIKK